MNRYSYLQMKLTTPLTSVLSPRVGKGSYRANNPT